MAGFVNIGFGNIINRDKVTAIVSPESAPAKRMVIRAKEEGKVIDATQGRKTKGVIILENQNLVLSALQPETLAGRFNQAES